MLEIFTQRQARLSLRDRRARIKLLSVLATGFFICVVLSVLSMGLLFAWFAKDLPRPDKVKRSDGLSTVILDRSGESLYDIYENENRLPVVFENIPPHLKEATVAIEDKNFYEHQGLSTVGIVRAFINVVVFRKSLQSGSTLTQQLVKNVLLSSEQTLPRKIKEVILAIQIERKYSKDEIIQMYLNEVPYGGTAVGAEAAAKYYFDKHLSELSLVECAILAGIPQSPSRYSPFMSDSKAYVGRTHSVLRRMREDGYITQQEEEEAKKQAETMQFATGQSGLRAPHFVAFVKDQLVKKFGEETVEGGGLRITTTLDWKLQEKAQQIVLEEIEKAKKLSVSNGAAVVIDPKTGQILAMVGSKDYSASDSGGYKFNVVTQGLRQPGSTMKPITFAAAFKKGYTPATLLMDVETKYPSGEAGKEDYNPKNYDLKYRGPMQLRYALGNSINTIAVKVSALVGIKDVLKVGYDMGLSTLEPTNDNLKRFGLSLTLGGGEVTLLDLTSAFGVFATEGNRQEPVSILKVEDSQGKVLFEHKETAAKKVLADDVSFLINSILSDNDARKTVFGTNSLLVIPGRSVAVKTGTTDDKRDNWTVGYSPSIVVGVWVGNNDNSPMHQSLASGVTGAAPIWNKIIREALKDKKEEPFKKPNTIVEIEIDALGGGLPVDGSELRKEFFVKGTEPTGPSQIVKVLKVSKRDNNKLANSVEIAKGEYDSKTFTVFAEKDPVSGDGKNRWQEGIDAWVATQPDNGKYKAPTETYSGSDGEQLTLRVNEPRDGQQLDDNNVRVVADATSINDVKKIELFVDGVFIKDKNEKNISENITIPNGSHKLRVRATDSKGNVAENELKLGIKEPYSESTPTPTP